MPRGTTASGASSSRAANGRLPEMKNQRALTPEPISPRSAVSSSGFSPSPKRSTPDSFEPPTKRVRRSKPCSERRIRRRVGTISREGYHPSLNGIRGRRGGDYGWRWRRLKHESDLPIKRLFELCHGDQGLADGRVAPSRSPWNHRQHQARRMLGVVEDRLERRAQLSLLTQNAAGVRIAIEAREITARNLDPELVSAPEEVARRPEIDPVKLRLARGDRNRRIGARGIARPRAATR